MGSRSSELILKCICMAICIYLIDVCGLFIHLFELNYEINFHYPSYQNGTTTVNEIKPAFTPAGTVEYLAIRHNASKICRDVPFLTYIIKSAIGNSDRRAHIRRTWGFEKRFSNVIISRVFVVGTNLNTDEMRIINAEAHAHGDIMQTDFYDTYFNNTLKTLSSMRWAVSFCSNSQYYMFVDDDYYVSTKNVLRFIAHPECYADARARLKKKHTDAFHKKLFAGFVIQSAPHRHKFSKWYVSLKEYPFDMWPPYVTAGAFILSRYALFDLYHASLRLPLFRFDDIFIGIAAILADLELTHCDMFYFKRPKYNGPESYRYVIASHGFDNGPEVERVWNECRAAGFA